MGESNKPGDIFNKINLIMKEVGGIEKDRSNTSQGYKFRGIDDVYLKLQPLLAKHGVFTTLDVIDEQRTEKPSKSGGVLFYSILKIRYDFWAVDGSNVSCTVIGEGMDSGDKASNKAMSVAQKYAFLQVFSIPTSDPKDPENDSPEVAPEEPETYTKPELPKPTAKIEPKTYPKPPIKKTLALVDKEACLHEWRKSKFPAKDGGAEEYCSKCKAKRPFL